MDIREILPVNPDVQLTLTQEELTALRIILGGTPPCEVYRQASQEVTNTIPLERFNAIASKMYHAIDKYWHNRGA